MTAPWRSSHLNYGVGPAVTSARDNGGVQEHPRQQPQPVTEVGDPQSRRLRRRKRWYFGLMGVCLVLIVLAWNVVRLWSTTAAVVMSVVAAVIPPVAAIVANWGEDH